MSEELKVCPFKNKFCVKEIDGKCMDECVNEIQEKIETAKNIFADSCKECELRNDSDCHTCPVGKIIIVFGGDDRWSVEVKGLGFKGKE